MLFKSRLQAGEKLSRELLGLELVNPFVLAIPKGGVPVGSPVAEALCCPLDVIPVVRIPIPWSPEASYGAIAPDGTLALNMPLIHRLELSDRELEMASARLLPEIRRRETAYRAERPFPQLRSTSVIIVDDGLVSGYSMRAAVDFVKKRNPRMIVAASPVASDMAFRMLAALPQLNLLIVLVRDQASVLSLYSYYKDFTPVTDADVGRCLERK